MQIDISNTKVSEFFEDQFNDRKIQLQSEVTSPENDPHILPPDDLKLNSDLPEVAEVQQVMKEFKNGKCMGTDSLHPEHLKYNKSNRFLCTSGFC